jgi:hypothetical protein
VLAYVAPATTTTSLRGSRIKIRPRSPERTSAVCALYVVDATHHGDEPER